MTFCSLVYSVVLVPALTTLTFTDGYFAMNALATVTVWGAQLHTVMVVGLLRASATPGVKFTGVFELDGAAPLDAVPLGAALPLAAELLAGALLAAVLLDAALLEPAADDDAPEEDVFEPPALLEPELHAASERAAAATSAVAAVRRRRECRAGLVREVTVDPFQGGEGGEGGETGRRRGSGGDGPVGGGATA